MAELKIYIINNIYFNIHEKNFTCWGHMGEALLTSWLKSNNYYVTVIDPIKYNYLKNNYKNKKIQIFKSVSKIDKYFDTDFIIFAVKPFDLKNVLDEFSEVEFKKTCIVISIIAGKRIKEFKNRLKKIKYFFRVMPNLPLLSEKVQLYNFK